MSIINVRDEHSTATYYISLATAPEMCTDTAWFIKNKHHILSPCCSTNVIIPVAVHRNTENVITWQEKDGVVIWESQLGWLHGCVLCEPRGNKSSFSSPEAWSSFTHYLWAGSQGFEWLWPLWPLLAPTGLHPSSCSSFQSSTLPSTPRFAEAKGAAPLWA